MRIRRILGILSVILVAALLFLWLPGKFGSDSGPPIGEELRFAHFGGLEEQEFWRTTIESFRNETSISVRQESLSGLDEQFHTRLNRQATDQELPDVVLVPSTAFRELAGYFEVLDGHNRTHPAEDARAETQTQQSERPTPDRTISSSTMVSEGMLESTGLKAFEVNGQQRGLPFSGGNLLIFLNKKAFQKASAFHGNRVELPEADWTVAQFLRTAEKLTCDFDRDGTTDQFGFWLPRWVSYLPFIWSFGADITDENGTQWTFSGPTAQAVMRFYRQLATGDRVAPREEEVPQLFQDTGFLTGKTAMCVNGPWFIPFLEKTDLARDYAVAPIPRGPGGRATRITWDGLALRKGLSPERRDQGRRFIDFALSKPVQERFVRTGRALPALVDAYPAFVVADPQRRQPFIDALSYSRLQPPLPRFETLDRAITRHFGEAVDPEKAFEALTMLDALAHDPAIVDAFQKAPTISP